MAKPTRSDDWGFPRWRPYGAKSREAVRIRLCDREGCNQPGDRPAPKAPNKPDRWMFCETHAGEYNKGWNYFAGLHIFCRHCERSEAIQLRNWIASSLRSSQ